MLFRSTYKLYYIVENKYTYNLYVKQEDNNVTLKEIAFKLEDLQTKSWALNSLTLAVHDAIVEGPNETSNFDGALHVLTCMAHELEGKMKELSDALFEVVRAEKKGVA